MTDIQNVGDPEVLMIQAIMVQLRAFDYATRSRILAYLTARADADERTQQTAGMLGMAVEKVARP